MILSGVYIDDDIIECLQYLDLAVKDKVCLIKWYKIVILHIRSSIYDTHYAFTNIMLNNDLLRMNVVLECLN